MPKSIAKIATFIARKDAEATAARERILTLIASATTVADLRSAASAALASSRLVDVEIYSHAGGYSNSYEVKRGDFAVQTDRLIRRVYGEAAATGRDAGTVSQELGRISWSGLVAGRRITISRAA